MKNQFGVQPKEPTFMYCKPYPKAYDQIALQGTEFYQVLRQDNMTTVEYISWFLI